MSGPDQLLRFYLDGQGCSVEDFIEWFQENDLVNRRRSSGVPHRTTPPADLQKFRAELGLALVNFLRDQSADIRSSSQSCYPSPVKAPPRTAKYDYQSPIKSHHPSRAPPAASSSNHGQRHAKQQDRTSASRRGEGGNGGVAKKRHQLFKGSADASNLQSASSCDAADAFDMRALSENVSKLDKLEERCNNPPMPLNRELKMVSSNSHSKATGKYSRRSLDTALGTPSGRHPPHVKSPPPSTLADFVMTKSDKQAAKKNRKKKAKSLSPVQQSISEPRNIPGLNFRRSNGQNPPANDEPTTTAAVTDAAVTLNFDEDAEVKDQKPEEVQPVSEDRSPRRIEKHDLWVQIARSIDSSVSAKKDVATILLNTPSKMPSALSSNDDGAALIEANPASVTEKETLDRLASLYAHVVKHNLVVNVSAEMYFLVELLTAQETVESHDKKLQEDETSGEERQLLHSIHNCVHFAATALSELRHAVLRYLDQTAVSLLSRNCRLRVFAPDLATFVRQLDAGYGGRLGSLPPLTRSGGAAGSSFESVRFDPQKDNQANFPSDRLFVDFKKQRDLLYEMLTRFERNRIDWRAEDLPRKENKFKETYGKSMAELLAINNHPVLLSRLARLFRDQLLTMCVSEALEVEHAALVKVDPLKNAKLEGRFAGASGEQTLGDGGGGDLTASVLDDAAAATNFFGSQEFFKHFIVHCEHHAFLTHLRSSLVRLIQEQDDEAFGDAEEEVLSDDEVVRLAKTVVVLRTAAKFLALIETLPFRGKENFLRDSQELVDMRQGMPLPLDLLDRLKNSVRRRRVIVTLPWLIDFVSELDPVTIRSQEVVKLLELMSDLYKSSLAKRHPIHHVSERGSFLLTSALGNLFENPAVPRELMFNTPAESSSAVTEVLSDHSADDSWDSTEPGAQRGGVDGLANAVHPDLLRTVRCALMHEAKRLLLQFVLGKKSTLAAVGTADEIARQINKRMQSSSSSSKPSSNDVSSSGGRRISLMTDAGDDEEDYDPQEVMETNFLRNQSADVCRSLDFVSERIASKLTHQCTGHAGSGGRVMAAVKSHLQDCVALAAPDFADEAATAKVKEDLQAQADELAVSKVGQLKREAKQFMEEQVPKRVEESLTMLLPDNMDDGTRRLIILLCTKRAKKKCYKWIKNNINHKMVKNTFSELLKKLWQKQEAALATDLRGAGDLARQPSVEPAEDASPASVLITLKALLVDLHCPKRRVEVTSARVLSVLRSIEPCFDDQISSATPHRMLNGIVFISVDLALSLVAMVPHVMTADVQDILVSMWSGALPPAAIRDAVQSNVLSPHSVQLMALSPASKQAWERMEALLVRLCRAELLLPIVLEDQCLALTRMEWDKELLGRMASCLQGVVDSWKIHVRSKAGTSHEEEEFAQLIDWLCWFWKDLDGNFEEDFPELM